MWESLLPSGSAIPGVTMHLKKESEFLKYLLSEDSRLPSNALVQQNARPATEMQGNDADGTAFRNRAEEDETENDTEEEEQREDLPPFNEEVTAVAEAIRNLNENCLMEEGDYGVVVHGMFSCANDSPWCTTNGTLRCADARDVFMTFRCSSKLIADLELQLALSSCLNASVVMPPSIRLRKHMNFSPDSEFRLFIENGRLVAVSQRCVDQIFERLATLQDDGLRRLGSKFCDFISKMLKAMQSTTVHAPQEVEDNRSSREWREHPTMMVDVIYEGGTLPVVLVGVTCYVSLAEAEKRSPGIQCNPHEEETPSDGHTKECTADNDAITLTAVEDGAALPIASLPFRLFRDLQGLRNRLDEHTCNKSPLVYVATSSDDLCGDGEKLFTPGLPLELRHPELFMNNELLQQVLGKLM